MKLSVIIPCLNAADTIAAQLNALANQYWSEPWEVIISDNGSTDETLSIIEQYREQLPDLRIVDSSDRRGSAHARNMGVQAALSESIAFCDADDEVAQGWVGAMGEALEKFDLTACKIEDQKLNGLWVKESGFTPPSNGIPRVLDFLPAAATWGLGIRRSLHTAIGGFDEEMYKLVDIDYCWRAQLKGAKINFVPDAVVHYRYTSSPAGKFRKARLDGKHHVLLFHKYRKSGMPWRSWKAGIKSWLTMLKWLPHLRTEGQRLAWIHQMGINIGRLEGSLKYRMLAL